MGKTVTTTTVDQKHRIVIDKKTRSKINLKPGDAVIIEPIDSHSFKVQVADLTSEKIEDDPFWQILHKPAKIKHYIPPEELEKLMDETIWEE